MMFSSNQVFQISGALDHQDELKNALEFALKMSGEIDCFTRQKNPATCVYQITKDSRYCIGWAFTDNGTKPLPNGWSEFPFEFDIDIISRIIAKHLEKQEIVRDIWDGGYSKGFLMKVIEESLASESDGIKNPFHGIVQFEHYTCFYSK